jgi:hypothetical protein
MRSRARPIALSTVSGITLRNVLPEIHDLTWQTIMLKVGLRLGFVASIIPRQGLGTQQAFPG